MHAPWYHYEPFLNSHGYSLACSPGFDDEAEAYKGPLEAAQNPFKPRDDESLQYALNVDKLRPPLWDHFSPPVYAAVDKNGRYVFVKAFPEARCPELEALRFLSSEPLRSDPANHTIPVLEFLSLPEITFAVMPGWGWWSQSAVPRNVREWLSVAYDLTEGLDFMHRHGVAHRDIHPLNTLFNFIGWIPTEDEQPSFMSRFARCFAYIDFQDSSLVQPGSGKHVVQGVVGAIEFLAPEIQDKDSVYDAYAADVYALGKTLLKALMHARDVKNSLAASFVLDEAPAFIEIIKHMTHANPSQRSTAGQALNAIDLQLHTLPSNTLDAPHPPHSMSDNHTLSILCL